MVAEATTPCSKSMISAEQNHLVISRNVAERALAIPGLARSGVAGRSAELQA
jgi:hypothetical protein